MCTVLQGREREGEKTHKKVDDETWKKEREKHMYLYMHTGKWKWKEDQKSNLYKRTNKKYDIYIIDKHVYTHPKIRPAYVEICEVTTSVYSPSLPKYKYFLEFDTVFKMLL